MANEGAENKPELADSASAGTEPTASEKIAALCSQITELTMRTDGLRMIASGMHPDIARQFAVMTGRLYVLNEVQAAMLSMLIEKYGVNQDDVLGHQVAYLERRAVMLHDAAKAESRRVIIAPGSTVRN